MGHSRERDAVAPVFSLAAVTLLWLLSNWMSLLSELSQPVRCTQRPWVSVRKGGGFPFFTCHFGSWVYFLFGQELGQAGQGELGRETEGGRGRAAAGSWRNPPRGCVTPFQVTGDNLQCRLWQEEDAHTQAACACMHVLNWPISMWRVVLLESASQKEQLSNVLATCWSSDTCQEGRRAPVP